MITVLTVGAVILSSVIFSILVITGASSLVLSIRMFREGKNSQGGLYVFMALVLGLGSYPVLSALMFLMGMG